MPRTIRARRTSTAITENDKLRDQFLRQLTRDAESTLRQLTQQFNQDLERQSSSFLSGLMGSDAPSTGGTSHGLFGLFSSARRTTSNRLKASESSRESSRSQEENDRFRLSQSQFLAETTTTIARGDKNS